MRMVADALTDPVRKKEVLARFDPIMQQIFAQALLNLFMSGRFIRRKNVDSALIIIKASIEPFWYNMRKLKLFH